jgi:hypothetical protein
MSYIEREAAITELGKARDEYAAIDCANELSAMCGAIETIKDIPAADVAPIVRAEWEEDADDIACPVCKNHWNKCDNDTETFDRCPRCGAVLSTKMQEADHA